MTSEEVDEFLTEQRTCRVGTASADGVHVTPLWFVWDGTALWLNSLVRSQRWHDLAADGRVSVLVDAGEQYSQLRGIELRGTAIPVGEVPRTGAPNPVLDEPELLFARKYSSSQVYQPDGAHAWLRIEPSKIASWDFRKRPA